MERFRSDQCDLFDQHVLLSGGTGISCHLNGIGIVLVISPYIRMRNEALVLEEDRVSWISDATKGGERISVSLCIPK